MSSSIKDSPAILTTNGVGSEKTVNSIRSALHHWQTWDAEYEALKEEVSALTDSASQAELVAVKKVFRGELVDQKEIDDIFGKAVLKSRDHIINVLNRRLDYVGENVRTLKKQLEQAEDKSAVASVTGHSNPADEDGQPVTDIVEELDESGNVLSYSINTPGQSLPHVRKVLEKAGINDLVEENSGVQTVPISDVPANSTVASLSSSKSLQPTRRGKKSASGTSMSKKTVSFTEDTKATENDLPPVSRNVKRLEAIMQTAKEHESIKDPIIPEDEEPEDAVLRQEMLRYGLGEMGEVGAVVAELQLEEGSSEDDDWDYSDEGYDDEEDGEDANGRTTGRVITEDYAERMLELEMKLGIKSRFTEAAQAAAEQDPDSDPEDDEGIGRIVINHEANDPASAQMPQPLKSSIKETGKSDSSKGVRFAANLDIATEQPQATDLASTTPKSTKEPLVEPLSDVVERKTVPITTASTPGETSRKPSRFKNAKARSPAGPLRGPLDAPPQFLDHERDDAPTGPEGKTIVDTLVEKESTFQPGPLDDEFDDSSTYQDIADEHQRLRRKFVHRHGGFLQEDEAPIQPLDEDNGGKEKMSRFRAARLSRQ